jgi:wobble nucleotide-excising tRNase
LLLVNTLFIFANIKKNKEVMTNKKMTEEELRWRAEEDARTLERYQEIMNDKSRLERAMKQAQKTIDNLQQRANAMSKSLTGIKNTKK